MLRVVGECWVWVLIASVGFILLGVGGVERWFEYVIYGTETIRFCFGFFGMFDVGVGLYGLLTASYCLWVGVS